MFSALLLGYKLGFLIGDETFDEIAWHGFRIIEDRENCCTYIGERISENDGPGTEIVSIDWDTYLATKKAVLAAVDRCPMMKSYVERENPQLQLYHINLEV